MGFLSACNYSCTVVLWPWTYIVLSVHVNGVSTACSNLAGEGGAGASVKSEVRVVHSVTSCDHRCQRAIDVNQGVVADV